MGLNITVLYVHAAEAAMRIGQLDVAQHALDSTSQVIQRHGARAWDPEIGRVQGELMLMRNPDWIDEAEAHLQHSLDRSRERQGRMLELRASVSLARLRASRGKKHEARSLLQPIVAWFTEGFETPDFLNAQQLLTSLQEGLRSSKSPRSAILCSGEC